jgi:hypothetical protein
MEITICGSIAFYEKMLEVKKKLEAINHKVKLPPHEIEGENGEMMPVKEYYQKRKAAADNDAWIWDRKEEAMRRHFEKVASSDAILVLNYDKNNIRGYIGPNTLMEMGLAFFLKKKIYLLNQIPELPYKEEVLGMKPVIIKGNFQIIA